MFQVVVLLLFAVLPAVRPQPPTNSDCSTSLEQVKEQGRCFWTPDNADDAALVPHLQQCLRGKRIYIVGTSVSRNWYFQLVNLFQADNTTNWLRDPASRDYRTQQKKACGGGQEQAREACKTDGIVFRWQNQNIFDDALGDAMLAGNYDIIVANTGLGNIVHHPRHWQGRLLKQGRELAELVSRLPSSTRFYWRTTTQICPSPRCKPDSNFDGCGVPDDANAMIALSNFVLPQLLQKADPRVQILDVSPLANCSFYDDHVHHPHLTIDHLLLLVSRECPQLIDSIVHTCPHLCAALQRELHFQDVRQSGQPRPS